MENIKPKSRSTVSESPILVVEDDPISSKLVCEVLNRHNVSTICCESIKAAKKWIHEKSNIVGIILDLGLPDGDGIEFMRSARKCLPHLPCLILTARDHALSAVLAMKAGASDYFTKPFHPESLLAFVSGPVEIYSLHRSKAEKKNIIRLDDIQWESPAMRDALQAAKQSARLSSPIMLLGACSTGKSTVAQLIHQSSRRADHKLQTFDAAALRTEHLVNGMFGKTKAGWSEGTPRVGRMAANSMGTVYIQNIDRLDSQAQALMMEWYEFELRHLEQGDSSPRMITSSCINLEQAVREGRFREDLWYALSVFQIKVPEICDRREDLPLLCEQFITRICVTRKMRRPKLTRQAMEILMRYNWPGNLGELHNVLEQAIGRTHDGLIGPGELPPLRLYQSSERSLDPSVVPFGKASIEEVTKASLVAALDACGGNRRMAAMQLKISLRTVYNMIQRYEIAGKRQRRFGHE